MRTVFLVFALFIFCSAYLCAQQDYAEIDWIRKFIGSDSIDATAKGMVMDKSGNVYVAIDDFAHPDSTYLYDYVIVKYNSVGDEVFVRRYSNPQAYSNQLRKIIIDDMNNFYIAGDCEMKTDSGSPYAYIVQKYDCNGNQLWTVWDEATFSASSRIWNIELDNSKNVYIVSWTGDILEYDSNGKQLWKTRDNCAYYSLALDDSSNIYLAGSTFVRKYNAGKMRQWTVMDSLQPRTIQIDKNNNIYVCGREGLTKYSPGGSKQWIAVYGDGFYQFDYLSFDNAGNIIVVGRYADLYADHYAVIKYTPDGTKLWYGVYACPGSGPLDGPWGPSSICIDMYNNVYISGIGWEGDGTPNITTIKYSSSGTEKWIMRYVTPLTQGMYEPPNTTVKVDSGGNVYVSGIIRLDKTSVETITIKYKQPNFPDAVGKNKLDNYTFQLFPNYPNPFNPSTTIQYELKRPHFITLTVYNLLGEEIKTLVQENQREGVHTTQWDGRDVIGKTVSSGIYFCRLQTTNAQKSIKLLFLK